MVEDSNLNVDSSGRENDSSEAEAGMAQTTVTPSASSPAQTAQRWATSMERNKRPMRLVDEDNDLEETLTMPPTDQERTDIPTDMGQVNAVESVTEPQMQPKGSETMIFAEEEFSTPSTKDVPMDGARQRKRNRLSPELAEGDIELLREAGVTLPERRRRSDTARPRRRRLRQAADLESASEEASREVAPPAPIDVEAAGRDTGHEVFDWAATMTDTAPDIEKGEGTPSLSSTEQAASKEYSIDEDDIDEDEDDLEDFIDYDDGEAGRRRRRLARQRARAMLQGSLSGRAAAGIDSYAVTMLRELFGDPEALADYTGEPLLYHNDSERIRAWLQSLGLNEPGQIERALSLDNWPEDASAIPTKTSDQDEEEKKTSSATILSVEQSEMLAELYATPRDDAIRTLDIPEYTQMYHLGSDQEGHPLPREAMDDSDIRYEAEWIVTNGLTDLRRSSEMVAPESALVEQVVNLLRFLHLEHLDVAFIAMYRRSYLEPDLLRPLDDPGAERHGPPVLETPAHFVGDWSRLWRALEWDRRYFQFLQQKRRLMDWYEEHWEQELFTLASAAFRREMLLDVERYARIRHQLSLGFSQKATGDAGGATALPSHDPPLVKMQHGESEQVPAPTVAFEQHQPSETVNDSGISSQDLKRPSPDLVQVNGDESSDLSSADHDTARQTPTVSLNDLTRSQVPGDATDSARTSQFTRDAMVEASTSSKQVDVVKTLPLTRALSSDPKPLGNCRPSRRDPLHVAMAWVRAHQIDIEALYGLRCGDLASNVLSGGSRVVEPADQPNKPTLEEMLVQWQVGVAKPEPHPERPLLYIRQVAAALYAAHPRLRHFVRTRLRENARLEVEPSARALQELDVLDPLRPYCAVRDLPVASLQPLEMALFLHAERLGLVKHMQCTLAATDWAELEATLERALLSDKLFESAQAWNAARKLMLSEQLLAVWLVPPLLDELLESLREEARAVLSIQATVAFERQLVTGGAGSNDKHSSTRLRADRPSVLAETAAGLVLAFIVTDEDDGAYSFPGLVESASLLDQGRKRSGRWVVGAAVDAYGQVLDAIRLGAQGWLSQDERLLWQRATLASVRQDAGGGRSSAGAKNGHRAPLPAAVRETLERFLRRHPRRDCVVVGVGCGSNIGVNAASLCLYDYLRDLERHLRTSEMVTDATGEQVTGKPLESLVRRLDDEVARLYAKTKAMQAPLSAPIPPACDGMSLRCAIGLARLCQEPLVVYATIASEPTLGALLRLQERLRPQPPYAGDRSTAGDAELAQPELALANADELDLDSMLTEPRDRLLAVERALRHAVASIGLDLNLLLRYNHLRPMMHFAPGMGIRKASFLFQVLGKQYGSESNGLVLVPSRQAVQRSGAVTPRVAESLIGFLRIRDTTRERSLGRLGSVERAQERLAQWRRRSSKLDESTWKPLDDTRIHPADESLALKIALESLRERDPKYWDTPRIASTPASVLLLHLLEHPEAMDELDLPGYATYLEQAGHGRKSHTLFLIECEFHHPFADWRQERTSLEDKALFYACTGLNERLFGYGTRVHAYDGRAVQRGTVWRCHVVATNVSGASDALPGRLEAAQMKTVWQQLQHQPSTASLLPPSLRIGSSDQSLESISASMLPSDTVLPLRVLAVDGEGLQVQLMALEPLPPDLATKATRVSELPYRVPLVKAPTTTTTARAGDAAGSDASVSSSQALVPHRAASLLPAVLLRHPSYRPISGRQAVAELAASPPGTVCFRPCSRQPQALSASFKIHDRAPIVHLDLEVEEVLDGMAGAGTQRLATTTPSHRWRLRLGADLYDDLDEVLARFIEPVVQLALEASQHPKFLFVDDKDQREETALQTLLRQEKAAHPRGIPYRLAFSRQRPAHLVFAYLPGRSTVLYEPIALSPSGYRLRDQVFPSLTGLINWFKHNWQRLVRSAPAANRPEQSLSTAPAHVLSGMTRQSHGQSSLMDAGTSADPSSSLGTDRSSSLAQLAQRALERSGAGMQTSSFDQR
jgi:hypothetical protein